MKHPKGKQIQNLLSLGASRRQVAKELHVSRHTVDKFCQENNVEQKPIQEVVHEDFESLKLNQKASYSEQKYKALLKEYEELEHKFQVYSGIKDQFEKSKKVIEVKKTGIQDEAVALAVLSDIHFGAVVNPRTVNNLNEVNPEITAERIERFFINLLSLVNKERKQTKIDILVLAMLGDFIENNIHTELLEDSVLSPIQEMLGVQNCIARGLDYLLSKGDFKEIIIPTSVGNHGRSTDKMRIQTSYKNSYEQLMYWNLENHYKNESNVKFQINDSYFNYLKIYDWNFRFHHGDAVRYSGGIGGISIPLRKFIYRANTQINADMSVNGHFHSLLIDQDIMVNGSLIGPTAYSLQLGFPPERPQQIFRLVDKKRGLTGFFPVLID